MHYNVATMKRKLIPLALATLTIPAIAVLATTSCSNTIRYSLTDLTRYDEIIKPAKAQTVTTPEELKALSEDYLNTPKKVAAD
jgi:hypothetical protein